ncbi:MAG: HAMP domain-containing histidine kinase [Balneola sp.]|nr:HAMP domain-containing histidine kinase [Balneola sp.]MBO6650847.1 HAMP domain-containing histidine kinase [Balneola sp.]MBO6710044.1 HAMP domain-containing histidine kinase [Balneola sp.]MBO6798728.1 HAMP domain-containing histidine kinase [Balneola sp.]MBO6869842.1 HAMP domain-containing histidine kinase [Balneola sp.]
MAKLSIKDPRIVSVIGLIGLIGYIIDALLFPVSYELALMNIACSFFTSIALIFHLVKKPKIEFSLSLFALILLVNLLVAPFFQIAEPDFSSFYIRNTLFFWVIMPLLGLTIHKNMFILSAVLYLLQFGVILVVSKNPFLVNSSATIFLVLIGYLYIILFLLRMLEESAQKTEKLINDLRENNKELINKREELSSLVKTKDKLFSVLAHDLQSPFMGISGLSEMIKKNAQKGNTDGVIEYSNMIADTTKRTSTLFTNLLDWAASQTGELEMKHTINNLDECLDETIALLQDHQQRKNITILRDNTNINISADPNGLKTVLRNLISNALKFTPQDGMIKISSERNRDEVVVSISDSGVGIKSDLIPQIFKKDTYISTEGTDDERGTGIGLSLCKEMIDRHNGKIWAESELGQGSVFYFSLPDLNPIQED